MIKAYQEKQLLSSSSRCIPGTPGSFKQSLNPDGGTLGRPVLDTTQWGQGRIEATPHGHCIDATGNYAIKAADPKGLAQKASHLMMDDFSPPPPAEAYRPSKRITEPEAKGGRTGLFDILQNT